MSLSASEIVEKLNLEAHHQGGFYTETFQDDSILLHKSQLPSEYKGDRHVSSSINFLIPSGSVSRAHRIPGAETWHYYLGESLTIVELNGKDGDVKLTRLGPNLSEGEIPQYTVPYGSDVWVGAFPTHDFSIFSEKEFIKAPERDGESHYSLVGLTFAPAFHLEDYELAKPSDLIPHFPHLEPLLDALIYIDSE
ncbi:hypothetical protein TanjilG_13514 [Lupinus angustifolius]|uniref:DUF985 domain-containing protein n=1 Tax=Lupinus angustifolius TaxID=3871 RepID=A0A394D4X9_LUPAN|nr:PREDICTED: uncharacterized protein LOC109356355 [Lupinus angustifolius]XP_019455249.1 PREDICTED: uncharacterized protein LOC109356374 [Lupinus angustifolius]OIW18760.1 hypothetical protein TanjilG_13512 [Lupinus angustifolius]OIW18762.1 hypothetical protein TanjilG_13514 [Lupinus angustifolius]